MNGQEILLTEKKVRIQFLPFSFEIPNVGKAELGMIDENSLNFMQMGKKTMVAFLKEDYNKVIVWDINFEILEFVKYFAGSILAVFLIVFNPQESLGYGFLMLIIYFLLVRISRKMLKR